jgi:CDP-diacylglycerol--serine O-phosphatidyltransferase
MKRQVVLPNLLTATSLCCGLFVIFKMNMIQPGAALFEQVQFCVKILLVAAVLDVLDGALARAIHGESEFGCFFDSMADSVSFGIAPAVLVLKTLSMVPGTFLSGLLTVGAMSYALGGVLRLVRYSTTPPTIDPEKKGTFTGLPITAASMAAVSPTLLLSCETMQERFPVSDSFRCFVAAFVLFFLSYLMVSRWRFPSLKSLNVKVASHWLLLFIVAASSLVLFLALNHFAATVFIVTWGYVCAAWAVAITRLAQGKRQAALDEENENVVSQ